MNKNVWLYIALTQNELKARAELLDKLDDKNELIKKVFRYTTLQHFKLIHRVVGLDLNNVYYAREAACREDPGILRYLIHEGFKIDSGVMKAAINRGKKSNVYLLLYMRQPIDDNVLLFAIQKKDRELMELAWKNHYYKDDFLRMLLDYAIYTSNLVAIDFFACKKIKTKHRMSRYYGRMTGYLK